MWSRVAPHLADIAQINVAACYANVANEHDLAPSSIPVVYHLAGKRSPSLTNGDPHHVKVKQANGSFKHEGKI